MTEQNATENSEQQNQNTDQTGSDAVKNQNEHMVPISRLNQEIQNRKESDQTLNDIAQTFVDDVPEDMRDLIPDLPPASKIKWIQAATKKGLFNPQQAQSGPDSKRPGSKKAENFDGLSPQTIMSKGYKK